MAFLAQSIRGDGLMQTHRALATFEEDGQRLNAARRRFDMPPPRYASDLSGSTTRSPSPNIQPGEQENHREQRDRLMRERDASEPYSQFLQQTMEEEERVIEACRNGTYPLKIVPDFSQTAHDNVKKRWIEQGLWSDKWTTMAGGRWKHEEPMEVESESETDTDAASPLFLSQQPKTRRLKSEDERRRIAERLTVRKRERQASRPYYQFIYQISKERERMENSITSSAHDNIYTINSEAYEVVKSTWRKRDIWNEKWGVMPGMSWKHETPWEEAVAELGLQRSPTDSESPVSVFKEPSRAQSPFLHKPDPLQGNVFAGASVISQGGNGPVPDPISTTAQWSPTNKDSRLVKNNPQISDPEPRLHRHKSDLLHVSPPAKRAKKCASQVSTKKSRREQRSKTLHDDSVTSLCRDAAAPESVPETHVKQSASRQRPRKTVTGNPQSASTGSPQTVAKRRSERVASTKAKVRGT